MYFRWGDRSQRWTMSWRLGFDSPASVSFFPFFNLTTVGPDLRTNQALLQFASGLKLARREAEH
jgi:hypothetical protein